MLIAAEARDDRVGAAEACESLTKVAIGSNPDKYFHVGAHLSPAKKDEFVAFLK